MGEAAPQHDSAALGVEHALISAFRVSTVATAYIPGDIPSLLRHAYSRHFNKVMPVERDAETTSASASSAELESLQTMLSRIPPLKPTAQALLDRARSILADGPPLSMNVELAEGQELPVALHTLLQGTLWAVMMASGANPDLEDSLSPAFRLQLRPESKYIWFMCRKFYFCFVIAEKDGASFHQSDKFAHKEYAGLLFKMHAIRDTHFYHAQMPRALSVVTDHYSALAITPRGVWGYGMNKDGQLGVSPQHLRFPARVKFSAEPKLAAFEDGLAPWQKHTLVKHVTMGHSRTFIVTALGTLVAGKGAVWFVGPNAVCNRFQRIPMPNGFVPDHIINVADITIMSMGDRQLFSGRNDNGQMGLGHAETMEGMIDMPFWANRVIAATPEFNIFLSGRQLLFSGEVPLSIYRARLLGGHGEREIVTPAMPLDVPDSVSRVYISTNVIIIVSDESTRLWSFRCGLAEIEGFTAIQFDYSDHVRDGEGQWYRRTRGGIARCAGPSSPVLNVISL
ncbi:hypothetical protein J8273_5187 [Carpediemonas membranifera]|uniref:Uncharacterized protein n=1 Tax=Carpediemonas membranifera TaxID=201153 RepID=A0A8J6AUY1_9EUKA|nr:hypothetical protein J8273_5187 [Carpediemonas membranifera]|eukprot:KAG9392205.1 hypothetical protein J8273_5187 [Carpediemonas membranifera]